VASSGLGKKKKKETNTVNGVKKKREGGEGGNSQRGGNKKNSQKTLIWGDKNGGRRKVEVNFLGKNQNREKRCQTTAVTGKKKSLIV